jgi:outer membrane receptor protein involved in Fe transport
MHDRWVARREVVVLSSLFIWVWGACGQAIDSHLVGAVTDSSGASLSGAQITATHEETGVKSTTSTESDGLYRLDHLPIGRYTVEVRYPSLIAPAVNNVMLQLNRTTTLNFEMRVATQETAITVVEAPVPIDASTSQLQITFDAKSMVDVPEATNGSGFLNLSLLSAGVASSGGLGQGVGPSVGGQRPLGNRFTIDGADNNNYFVPSPLAWVSNEAVAEFSVLQNHFSSEFGGGTGGMFNAVVKTGTNNIHGSLFEYFQNRNLNALDAQYRRQGLTSPPRFDSNRFGGTIGGPVIKNRLFYFGNYEYNPVGYAFAPASTVLAPTAAGYQALDGLNGIRKVNLDVLKQYLPAAPVSSGTISVLGSNIPVGPLSIVAPSYQNTSRAVGSVDWNVSDRDQVRGRYIYNGITGIDTAATLPVFFVPAPSNTHLISLSEFHTFSATLQNEFRAAYSRNNSRRASDGLTFPGLDSFPTLWLNDLGGQLGPNPNIPSGQVSGELQLTNNLSATLGRHTLRAGYDFRDVIMNSSFVSYPRGYYGYLTAGQYLQDLTPDFFGNRYLSTTGTVVNGMPVGFLQNAAYVQDDFRVRPNLTLNLGVRYEYVTVPVMSRAQSYSALADVPGVITFREPQPLKTDWSPRIGFAYSPGKSGVWSIRGGFSRAFDVPFTNIASNTAPAYYGGVASVNINSNSPDFLANGGLTGKSGALSSPAAARAAITSYIPDQDRPYALNYTLAVQRRIGNDYAVEARYIGSKGVHLLLQEQINRVSAVTATQHIPTYLTMPSLAELANLTLTTGALKALQTNSLAQYGFTNTASITSYSPRGNSQYHGLALQVSKRYSKNYSFLAAYTWSHLMDDSTATTNTTLLSPRRPQDFNDIRSEWASSLLDRRHRFTFTQSVDVDLFRHRNWMLRNVVSNWNLAVTYMYESPEYATVQSGVDSNVNSDSQTDRAIVNLTGNPKIGSGVNPVDRNGNIVAASSNAIVAYVAKNPNAGYITAGLGARANSGRNTLPFDPINNFDAAIRKKFSIGETKRLEFGAQFFNVFNHSQYVPGYTNDVYLVKNTNRSFLIPSHADFGKYQKYFPSNSRFIQLVARFTF